MLRSSIHLIYILTPKNFYFYLPLFFRKIKFYGLCIDSTNNYKRPSVFLRKHLYKFVINNRATKLKRQSTIELQKELTSDIYYKHKFVLNYIPKFSFKDLKKPDKYIYFHLKIHYLKNWGGEEMN